jgi:cobalt/nickel transport system ATP-binding protein
MPAPMRAPILEIRELSFAYADGHLALRDICLTLQPGERLALVGANGSGKSTLLLHLNGIFLAQTGSIAVAELEVNASSLTQIRNWVGLVFQNPDDQLFMPTVSEDVGFGPRNQGLKGSELQQRIDAAMLAVGIVPDKYADRYAQNLSGGEKKRIAIAGVLAMNPQILALDEPSAQLDPQSRRQLIQLLDGLPQAQIIATHDLDLVLDLCSRTIILSYGQIVADGPTSELMQNQELLEQYCLELPLSYSRPYCQLADAPRDC